MPLPPFDPAQPVSPDDGREDKIQLKFGAWYLPFTATGPKEANHKIGILRAALMAGKLFAKVRYYAIKIAIPIRTDTGKFMPDGVPDDHEYNQPLFAGFLKTELIYQSADDYPEAWKHPGCYMCRLTFSPMSLNPLRFVRHQSLPKSSNSKKWGRVKWCKAAMQPSCGGEISFTGDDNWIPDHPEWWEFTNTDNWQRHLRRYITKLRTVFIAELADAVERAKAHYDVGFEETIECLDYSLYDLETAWEFSDSDPLEVVRSLKSRIFELGQREIRCSVYQGVLNFMRKEGHEFREFNSPGLQVKLRTGFHLRVYAKTNRRVRFEIVQEMGKNRKRLLQGAEAWQDGMTTNKDHSQIPRILKQARVDAAAMINSIVFPALASVPDLRIRQRSVPDFFADFGRVCEKGASLRAIVSMLITNDGIHRGVKGRKTPEPLRVIITKLVRHKLLMNDPKAQKFRVAARYRWALGEVRKADCAFAKALLESAPPIRVR